MDFLNHETQLALRLAGSKEFGLLLKLIFYNSFAVITGFPRPFNQRTRFKTKFHAILSLCEKTSRTSKGALSENYFMLNCHLGRRRPYARSRDHSASHDHKFSHRWVTIFSYPGCSAGGEATGAPLKTTHGCTEI